MGNHIRELPTGGCDSKMRTVEPCSTIWNLHIRFLIKHKQPADLTNLISRVKSDLTVNDRCHYILMTLSFDKYKCDLWSDCGCCYFFPKSFRISSFILLDNQGNISTVQKILQTIHPKWISPKLIRQVELAASKWMFSKWPSSWTSAKPSLRCLRPNGVKYKFQICCLSECFL